MNEPIAPKPDPSPTPKPSADAPKPAAPAATAEPALKRPAPEISVPGRRQFLSWFTIAWLTFVAATAGALSFVLRFMFPNVLFEPKSTFKVGYPDDYEVGVVDLRWKGKYGVWVVRTVEGIYALLAVCTHLGCTPNWLESEQKFKCPCHGSGFYKSGINFEGPAPRPLERLKIGLADDGQIVIDKSKSFHQEKGELSNSEAFLKL
ncbi:MAG: Rieske (2Fe-2S) protein [Candidatus Omnitrophica bacterium CG11_big_fil_rev_8_21_14_0_20_45_26]|uniref:Rieske (2Fe-2S) protein n=1 Tax=Candidatus Abzuiibacterium crystallinum TaxID=1974748 RepID=A0A2H0LRH7_9BACT|nr:MAG: Rieske (2Fe-2S) protein [Candidatus Omnitrophica bacterium CG11_big_fil_rev_8_21_14_0_20_45_26]PIW65716.1 MAG: Rieske (2Fe-2S) protein [Candidatus Omnitrophica bacterium CG12_big_fil_rev_8_21_14_0_65_45_16]